MNIKDRIETQIKEWGMIGRTDLMATFIFQNGREYEITPFKGKWGTPHECFSNSSHLSFRDKSLTYCEGFFHRPGVPILIHHAWCVDEKGRALDSTIKNNDGCEYFGVEISEEEVLKQMLRTGYYSVLCPGEMLNLEFMFAKDPNIETLFNHQKGKMSHVILCDFS